jgi:hypothetical protein
MPSGLGRFAIEVRQASKLHCPFAHIHRLHRGMFLSRGYQDNTILGQLRLLNPSDLKPSEVEQREHTSPLTQRTLVIPHNFTSVRTTFQTLAVLAFLTVIDKIRLIEPQRHSLVLYQPSYTSKKPTKKQ